MQTIERCYTEISDNYEKWSYYSKTNMPIKDKWHNGRDAFEFITNYFNYAGKNKVLEDKNIQHNRVYIEERACHIISTYLLGLKIADCFMIDTRKRDENNMSFQYYWFLTCLYHDIGYAYEKKPSFEQLQMIREEGIEALQEICDLKFVHKRIFRTYPESVVDFYLKCRADCRKRQPTLDHGIAGGLLLYDKLRKQFAKAWEERADKASSRDSFHVKIEVTNDELHVSNKHYEAYAKAADAIIAHNIWKETLKQYINEYRGNVQEIQKFSYKKIGIKNELCFILSLADTIEPLKRDKESLSKVSIEGLDGGIGFALKMEKETYTRIYHNIKLLEDWIEVSVDIIEYDETQITIKKL